MKTIESVGLQTLIVRPGATELDEQGRIAGNLDVPLSEMGVEQISALSQIFKEFRIGRIFAGPSSASRQTAKLLSDGGAIKIHIDDDLTNFDYGLWHGKRLDELKENQPRLFRLWQEQPQSVCPPNGETLDQLVSRVDRTAKKIRKKHKAKTVLVVAAEPVACILRSVLERAEIYKYWTIAANCGTWNLVSQQEESSSNWAPLPERV